MNLNPALIHAINLGIIREITSSGAVICQHGRQLSICATCLPFVEAAALEMQNLKGKQ